MSTPVSTREPRREALALSGLISMVGSTVGALAAMVLTVVVGRGGGADTTGLFFQVVALFSIITQVLKLGTGSGTVRAMSRDRALGREATEARATVIAVAPVLLLSMIVSGACFVAAVPLAEALLSAGDVDEMSQVIRWLAPFMVCAAVLGALQSSTRMVNSVTAFVLLQNVLLPLSRVATVLLALGLSTSVGGLLLAWAAPLPLWLVVTSVLLGAALARSRGARVGREVWREDARAYWAFTGPRSVGAALEVCLEWVDVLLVGALTDAATAGVYAVVTRVVKVGQIVDRAMRLAVSPRIAHHLARGDLVQAKGLHTDVARAMILLTWPYYLTLVVLGPAVLSIFGPEFASGAPVLAVFAVALMVAASAGMLQSVLLMGGRSSWQVYLKTLSLAMVVGGYLLLVPSWGLGGAAAAWALMIGVDTAIAWLLVERGMGVAVEVRKVLVVTLPPLVTFGAGGLAWRWLVGDDLWGLLVFLLVAGTLYLGALWRGRRRLGLETAVASLREARRR